jgi:hypothetical protein
MINTLEPQSAEPKRKGIFGLVAGLGCLGIAAIAVGVLILCVGLIGGTLAVVFGALKSSEPYQMALERAQSDPAVVEALGEPIQPGWWVVGSIETQGISGTADIQFPISGPKNSGTVFLTARRENGVWNFYSLAVGIEGQSELIDLR